MLIVPGFAVPAGTNLFDLITTKIGNFSSLFENFYLIKSGDFFIVLLIQQVCFGFLGTITQFGLLYGYYFSPSAYLLLRKKDKNEQKYLKDETLTFEFGYVYSLNLTILGIVFIYSIHIPFVLFFGILYFIMKYYTDAHLLLNMYKNEIDSSGKLVHNACIKVIALLLFFQFCVFLKVFIENKLLSLLLLVMFVLTFIVYIFNLKEILRTDLFIDEIYDLSNEFLKEWHRKYSHPMMIEASTGVKQVTNQDFDLTQKLGVDFEELD